MQTDWSVILTFLPQLLAGAKITIQITVIGLLGAAILVVAAHFTQFVEGTGFDLTNPLSGHAKQLANFFKGPFGAVV